MDKRDFFFGQYPSESEIDIIMTICDNAIKYAIVYADLPGAIYGLSVAPTAPPSFNVEVDAGYGFDKDGERLRVPILQTVDCDHDENGDPTRTDLVAGESRYISLFLHFTRANSDQRVDDDGNTVWFIQNESYSIRVVRGGITGGGLPPTPPALDASDILLCDILMSFGMGTITANEIVTTRREDQTYNDLHAGRLLTVREDRYPDEDVHNCLADWDTTMTVASSRQYGGEVMEYHDRYNRRVPGETFELVDDFCFGNLVGWLTETKSVGGASSGDGGDVAMGVWILLAANGGGAADYVCLSTTKRLQGTQRIGAAFDAWFVAAANAEYSCYMGVMLTGNDDLTDKGYGFYRKAGNVFARCHDGALFTDVDCLVGAGAETAPKRYEVRPVMKDDGTFERVVFLIDGVVVANIATNVPALVAGDNMYVRVMVYGEAARTGDKALALDRFMAFANRTYA